MGENRGITDTGMCTKEGVKKFFYSLRTLYFNIQKKTDDCDSFVQFIEI